MRRKEIEQVISQVKGRLMEAEQHFTLEKYHAADKVLSELRDVLDDIYDRPDKNVEVGT